ncbi:hypothetical protein [Saccharibacillus sacchari]|uniref:Uncharacterized protein n=1 Tax=Saccharibacillus sacchari TaxID=456493 RepID=A0ACC6P743_9BACL
MGKKRTGALAALLGLSMLLAACDAITAQNIPSTTSTAFNNGAGLGGANARMGMPGNGGFGGFDRNGGNGRGMRQAIDADLIGRITEVNGDTLTLALLERGSTAAGAGAQSPGGAADGQTEWIATGESEKLALGDDVQISSDAAPGNDTNDASELKSGQIVMVWYKEGTQTPERIRVLE